MNPGEENQEAVYKMLKKNFDKSYGGKTKAPFGLYAHAAWFFGAGDSNYRYLGYRQFLDEITQYPDVWIVPIHAGLAYRKSPVPNDLINGTTMPEFCYKPDKEVDCRARSCQ